MGDTDRGHPMGDYVEEGLSKSRVASERVGEALATRDSGSERELRHGAWIQAARSKLRSNPFGSAKFGLLAVFVVLYVGSVFLFESMDVIGGPLYGVKIMISSLFAVSLGVILSVWWQSTARFDDKIREAQRLDAEYRELLLSFSDSLFDIINALNTLAVKPPRPFVIATEFMLGEYVHLLQSQLQRYGDYVAALGFDASDFLDEKIAIFEGIRDRATLSIRGMPREIGDLFVHSLSLSGTREHGGEAMRQQALQDKLRELEQRPAAEETGAE